MRIWREKKYASKNSASEKEYENVTVLPTLSFCVTISKLLNNQMPNGHFRNKLLQCIFYRNKNPRFWKSWQHCTEKNMRIYVRTCSYDTSSAKYSTKHHFAVNIMTYPRPLLQKRARFICLLKFNSHNFSSKVKKKLTFKFLLVFSITFNRCRCCLALKCFQTNHTCSHNKSVFLV